MNDFHNDGYNNNINIGNKNLFASEKILSNVFVPNLIQLDPASSDSDDNRIYDFSCKDENINGINTFIVEIGLKELRGKGTVAYQRYLAYQLINNFKIRSISNKKNDCYLINQREIMTSFRFLGGDVFKQWAVQAGTVKPLCDFTTGLEEGDLLKPKTKIYARIKLPFDNMITEMLKFPKGSELLFTVSLKSINDAMCYNSSYMTNLTPKDMFEYVNLYATSYNILLGESLPNYYIEHEESLLLKAGIIKDLGVSKEDNMNKIYEETKNITKNVCSIKLIADAMLSGKRYLCFPGYDQTETNWVRTFHEKIVRELIIEVDEDVSISDFIKDNYKVNPKNPDNINYNNPILIPIENVKHVKIDIFNIPEGKRLYYLGI